LKVRATINNAQKFLEIQEEFGSFDNYVWQFVNGKPIVGNWETLEEVPTTTAQSEALSKDLKKPGFKFVGSAIIYAYMQACRLVNDHIVQCFRYAEILKNRI
jgi:DNA-3-methyladenine glycosylase I